MANLLNPWVGYIDRSYEQIKAAIVGRLIVSNPEITDYSETNPLVIIIDMFAGLLEMLGYYIDNMAREAFLETAQRYTSIIRLVRMLDYRVHMAFPAGVNIKFLLQDGSGNAVPLPANFTIPTGTVVKTQLNVGFITTQDLLLLAGVTEGEVGALQIQILNNQNIGSTDGTANQKVLLGGNLVDGSVSFNINGDIWENVSTFAFSKNDSKHFIIDVDTDGLAYAYFGDGVFGEIPTPGFVIYASFRITTGASANGILAGAINTLVSTITIPGVDTVAVTNEEQPNGGSDYESFALVKFRAPLSIRTLERAVTYNDYRDVALLHPQVQMAHVDFCCEDNDIKVYIAPVGGGIAQFPIVGAVQDWMDCRKIITTRVAVKPAGITHIKLVLEAKCKFRQDPILTLQDCVNAMTEFGKFDNSDINKNQRLSDILGLIDNLKRVEYANIISLKTEPYARPENSPTELNWLRETLDGSTIKHSWKLEYTLTGNFRIFMDDTYMGQVPINTQYTAPDNSFKFTILSGPYSNGLYWTFPTYPVNQDVELDDFTVPIYESLDYTINVIPSPADGNCKPVCNHS